MSTIIYATLNINDLPVLSKEDVDKLPQPVIIIGTKLEPKEGDDE